jgi:hypothetical protein
MVRARRSRIARSLSSVLVVGLLGGCAYLEGDDSTLEPVPGDSTTSVSEGVTTTAMTVPTSETTVPPTTTSTTTSTSTTTIPPPLGVDELILSDRGVGSALLGAAPDGVISYITSVLGSPTEDTGWVDPSAFFACSGTTVRRIEWGVLTLVFGDESPLASGRAHFMSYTYGAVDRLGDEPQGLRTSSEIELGSTVAELRSAHPGVDIDEGDPSVDIPPSFFVSDGLRGLLTGVDDDDLVLVVVGGTGCQA